MRRRVLQLLVICITGICCVNAADINVIRQQLQHADDVIKNSDDTIALNADKPAECKKARLTKLDSVNDKVRLSNDLKTNLEYNLKKDTVKLGAKDISAADKAALQKDSKALTDEIKKINADIAANKKLAVSIAAEIKKDEAAVVEAVRASRKTITTKK